LLAKLDEGYDVVSGWRRNRKDKMITRKILRDRQLDHRPFSGIAPARLRLHAQGLPARVLGIGESVRRDARFIPVYAKWAGARVTNWWSRTTPPRRPLEIRNLAHFKVLLDWRP